ncbi:hypothetical protein [Salipaludibacillus aurantiacus]|uniref:Uncharacterized protein n=1 Tax=Salipaludibacillus aurantiacus TaxID=1601833 RepID=A0A1H9P2G3_9BACI|nr:hypothetical protein [Salipaludibacillus aurantiacus]SER42257.1 hypothetical protein SAMN05518684_101113 [Salipaludibacillus aurantiacus]
MIKWVTLGVFFAMTFAVWGVFFNLISIDRLGETAEIENYEADSDSGSSVSRDVSDTPGVSNESESKKQEAPLKNELEEEELQLIGEITFSEEHIPEVREGDAIGFGAGVPIEELLNSLSLSE